MNYTTPTLALVLSIFISFTSCKKEQHIEQTNSNEVHDSIVLFQNLENIYVDDEIDFNDRIHTMDSLVKIMEAKHYDLIAIKGITGMNSLSYNSNNFSFAKENLNRAQKIADRNKDSKVQAENYQIKANYYYRTNNRKEALHYVLKTMQTSEKGKTAYANALGLASNIARESGDYATALKYSIEKTNLSIKKENGKPIYIAMNYLSLAIIHYEKGDTLEVKSYYEKAEKIINENNLEDVFQQNGVMGRIEMLNGNYQAAIKYFDKELSEAEYDLATYTQKAMAFDKLGKTDSVKNQIDLLESFRNELNVNNDYDVQKEYLPLKIKYSAPHEQGVLIEQYSRLMNTILAENKAVVIEQNQNQIYLSELEKENQFKIQEQKRQKSIILFVSIVLGLTLLLIVVIISNQRKKLKNELLTTRLEASKLERDRISQELHDDLGANITSILMASDILKEKNQSPDSMELNIILKNTRKIHSKINEVIWSLNSHNDTLGNLIIYTKRFLSSFLEHTSIEWSLHENTENMQNLFLEAFMRRRIYLAVKEIVNNTVKHAEATKIAIAFHLNQDNLYVQIVDNGKGFDVGQPNKGNGISNIHKTIESLKQSKIQIDSDNTGTRYNMTIKL